MQVVVTEEFCILLIADPVVDQDKSITFFDQEAAHGPCAKVIRIGCMTFLPNGPGHHTEHGTTIELEETGIDHV